MPSWRRTYWVVWTANLITAVGMMSFLPFFPSLLSELGLEDAGAVSLWAGAIFGAAPLAATFVSPIWGALGDRLGRKVMVVRAMLAIAVFVGAMRFAETPLQLFLLRLGQGFFSGFIPPSITLVSVQAPQERQGRIVADLQTALPLGAILGPFLGGLIAATSGHRAVFTFVGIAGLASALLVVFFAHEDPASRRKSPAAPTLRGTLAGLRADIVEVWSNRSVRAVVVLLFFLQFSLGSTNPVLEIYVHELLAGREVRALVMATSLLFGGMALANLVAIPLWGRYGDRTGHARAFTLAATGVVVSLFLQAALPAYALLFAGRLLMGVAMAGTGPLAFGVAAAETTVDKRGGAFGVVFSSRTLAVAVGGMAGGALATVVGVRGLLLLSGCVVGAALLVLRPRRRPDAELAGPVGVEPVSEGRTGAPPLRPPETPRRRAVRR